MPLVKVPLFTSHSSDQSKRQNVSGMQKFYRTGAENKKHAQNTTVVKKNSAKSEEAPNVKLNPGAVHNFLSQINVDQAPSKDKKKQTLKSKTKRDFDCHIYENVKVESGSNANVEPKTDIVSNRSKSTNNRENITVITVESKNVTNDLKLAKALETFDRLLSEFSPDTSRDDFVPPKLQKAKTCSIIEARCILKKFPYEFESSKKCDNTKNGNGEKRHSHLSKTKSLWNLNDMEDPQFVSKIPIFMPASNKFNTYKISGKEINTVIDPIKSSELRKLDVKTRILRKTFSNPPSTPIPVTSKVNIAKVERRMSDPNKKLKSIRNTVQASKPTTLTKSKTSDQIEVPKIRMQKSKSIWEVSKLPLAAQSNRSLSRTKSNTSLAGSTSKIPVVRTQNVTQKFSTTRALFSPTPDDLKQLDHSKDSAAGNKKSTESIDSKRNPSKKIDTKTFRITDKNRANECNNEINKVRAKIQQKRLNSKGDAVALENRIRKPEAAGKDTSFSPVKSIISKMEMHCAVEGQVEPIPYQSCKIISPLQRTIGVANMSTQSSFNTINKKPQLKVEAKNDIEVCKVIDASRKLSLASSKSFASSDEKIYEDHSDCSDDSGHVSNESEPIAKTRGGRRNLSILDDKDVLDNAKVGEISPASPTYATNNIFIAKTTCVNKFNEKPDLISDLSASNILKSPSVERRDLVVPVPAERRSQASKNKEPEVLLRAGALARLENARAERLRACITGLQAACRGVLARRALARRRVQQVAVRCIQRNVRAFLAVRDWPWWRLLVRVAPLLAVHRTEDQLKAKTEELESLRQKVEKLEADRSSLKHENDKLENKCINMPLAPSLFVNLPGGSHSAAENYRPHLPHHDRNYSNRTSSPLLSDSSDSPSRSFRSLNDRPPLSRPILPLRKSNTSPLSLITNGRTEYKPPVPSLSLSQQVRNNLFHSKPLKEIHTIPRLTRKPLLDSRILVSRSPSPASLSRSNGSMSTIETGSIADLQLKKSIYSPNNSSSPLSLYNSVKTTTSSSYSTCNGSTNHHNPARSLSVCSTRVTKSPTPRRIFPQASSNDMAIDLNQLKAREQAPVVFDANLTFVLGCEKQKVRQNFRPVAAHLDDTTASSYLSARIDDFLKRTDHVMDEWRNLGHKDEPDMNLPGSNGKRLGRSRSAANIMIKGFQLFSRSGSICRSSSYTRDFSEDRNTISEVDELSEMTAELAVEQAAGSLASERLSAETAERLRVERDLLAVKTANSTLQQTSERLETELMYARAETNGSVASETGEGGAGSDSEGSGDGGRYKRRLQVALRELEAARRQLRQQHEDDLEQLVILKKQLEKKAADAYEEAEEQRQVAAQWKRKAQKAASDANDVRLLLDEQGAKAVLLERRQRKFDAECQQLREEARRERQTRERAQRDYDTLLADKCALDQQLADTRMELEMKEEKLTSVQRELEDLTFGGKTEEEVGALKRIKHDLEKKCHDQEEELDELAGQVQLLESHKVRLEMSLEQQRKATRLEAAQREEELEEVRAQTAKKVKALESQLEMEHNERTLVLRERHELERRLAALEESARADASEREQREQRMKRDLRRYKALARDAQVVLERKEQDSGAKAQLRQLRDKLDDAEVALRAAQKARLTAETELAESLGMAEEAARGRREAEMRATQAQREATSARAQLEEAEEEAADVMKKYRACVAALNEEQRTARDALARATTAEDEAKVARERAAELAARLASADNATTAGQAAQNDKLELRTKELEASLELEQTARARLEAQAARARESASASAQALAAAQQRDIAAGDDLRKAMRTVRELREELTAAMAKCDEATRARSEAEARLEDERTNASNARADLRATNQRLLLLQQAIADDISPDNGSDSDNDSCSSDESIDTFLANHKLSPVQTNLHGSTTPNRSSEGRQSRSSVGSSKQMSPTKESFA